MQIAIPSLWKNGDFTPWELSASILGDSGLTAGSTSEQRDVAMEYLELASTPILNIFNVFLVFILLTTKKLKRC